MEEDAVDRSKVNDFLSEIVRLPEREQEEIAQKVVRLFDPRTKNRILSEFDPSVEILEARRAGWLRAVYLLVGALLLALCLGVVLLTARDAPDQVDKVIGTITTIAGLVGGFIGGKYGGPTQGSSGPTQGS